MGQLLHFPTRQTAAASRPVRPSTVADLLLALEDAPLSDLHGAVSRRFGRLTVTVSSTCGAFELSPDEARLAAHALFSEQAYVGSLAASAALMDLAELADAMAATDRFAGGVA